MDNILLAHELVIGYYTHYCLEKCALKIEIRKAYDSVEWDFLRVVCVTLTRFSVCIKGELEGFFSSTCGLY